MKKTGDIVIDTVLKKFREAALAARAQFSSVLDMNQTIVERWNRQVGLHDTVWCSGIVGDDSWLRLLNGDIRFGVPSDDSLQINSNALILQMRKLRAKEGKGFVKGQIGG